MANLKETLSKNLEDEKRKLRGAEDDVLNAQQAVERFKWKIDFIEGLLSEAEDSGDSIENPEPPRQIISTIFSRHRFEANAQQSSPKWIQRVLEQSSGPLRVKEIVDKIAESGMAGPHVDIKRLTDNVSSALNRKSATSPFKKLDRGVFDLKSRH